MSDSHKLSLPLAILINLNIMLGTGIFINTAELAKRAGILGAFAYLIVGFLMLPLIVSVARLLNIHAGGNFYTFGMKEISPLAGFLSTWCYFTGKLASSTLMIHISVMILQQIFPIARIIPWWVLDTTIILCFIMLNMLHIRTGSFIQTAFIGLKTIPIFFAIFVGLFLFNGAHVEEAHLIWSGIPLSLPLVLYAAIGFEAACSISAHIKDPARNAPLAVFISFALVILIATLYQFLFYGAVGSVLGQVMDFRGTFPELLKLIFPYTQAIRTMLTALLYAAVASSALGGAYGILFSNTWNLYALAQHGHTFAPPIFTMLNRHAIPWVCVLVEGLISFIYLAVSQGAQVPLQQISALGSVSAYSISVLSLLFARNRGIVVARIIPYFGMFSCSLLASSCIASLITNGASSLITFGMLIIFGIFMFFTTKKSSVPAI